MSMFNYNKIFNYQRAIMGTRIKNVDWSALELISLHIPKTAGTSFLQTLHAQYGKRKVVRVDHETSKETKVNMIPTAQAYVDRRPKVIHGHLSLYKLRANADINSDLPVITWLRDPVDRVISNYFYLAKVLKDKLQEEKTGVYLLDKMQKTLLEYVTADYSQNRMSKFLEGIDLNALEFIGFTDRYDRDIEVLANQLDWSTSVVTRVNQTGVQNKRRVNQETREIIAECNQKDIDLYKRALEIRGLT